MENIADSTQQLGTAVNPVEQENSGRDEKGRFIKGVSGNPKGKPKYSLITLLKDKLQSVAPEDKKTYAEKLINTMIKKAIADEDVVMIKDILNRIDGMPTQPIAGDNENPLVLQLNKVIANKNGIDNTTSEDSGMQE